MLKIQVFNSVLVLDSNHESVKNHSTVNLPY